MKNLTREELFETLQEVEAHPELKEDLGCYVAKFVLEKDREALERLLVAGAPANSADPLDDYLRFLVHEYAVERTLRGAGILGIMELLLKHGADPNRVTDNNLRAYDYAVGYKDIVVLFEQYGADPMPREPV